MDQPVVYCFWILFVGLLSVGLWSLVGLVHHIRLARATGLPFVILPYSLLGAPWQLAQFIVVPVAKIIPKRLTQNWLPLLLFNEFWHNGYEPFERVKADTFLAVSPGGLILYTCDPDVNTQLFRDGSFGKPAELMSILNIYGPTITGTDGPESRLYRKITGPFFSESTLRRVFVQSVSGATILLAALTRPDAHRQLRTLSARVSLNTLSQICYDNQTDSDLVKALAFSDNVPDGRTLSYSEALHGLMDNWTAIFLMPHWMLRLSPFRSHNHAAECYSELGPYMDQIKREKEGILSEKSVHDTSDGNLLDLLVQAGTSSQDHDSPPLLTNVQVIGQIFLFMFAGHEANANMVVSVILLLACHPEVQETMQRDLDRLLGQTSPDTWSYDEHYSVLMQTTVGAVINEALRLFSVIPVLPKCVPPKGPWLSINVKGQCHPLPPNTIALTNTSATHRHPTYWPKRPSTIGEGKLAWTDIRNDPRQRPFAVADFDPSRWTEIDNTDETVMGSGKFLKPRAGTFLPFSEGSRGCLGRRFALVEVCAVVSTLFKTHSVELITDPASGQNAQEAWLDARRRAALALSEGTRFDMSLRVARDVPFKFVPRDR
ncbi:Cytochrome P450 3A2 [Cytospora mali]|uniref:Cytochrome P450 3A2 n=1 Tax=Cytospora mali TaxID=578113 RepID=A0A194VSP9_CYTMA|nr:Cytochrome P450 3A2 [Valsa mali]